MPFVKIPKDAHNDMKQYLVDIDGLTLGDLIEASFEYCMEHLEDFETFLELEETDETEEENDKDKDDDQEEETEKEDE